MAAAIVRERRSIPPGVAPIAWVQTALAVRLAKNGDLAEADEHYRLALKWSPGYSYAAYDRSLVLLRLGRPAEALHDYLWAEERLEPKLPASNRRAFFDLYSRVMAAAGNLRLSEAAARRSAR
jgi:tetratricopeptide (TPR) repeat protein